MTSPQSQPTVRSLRVESDLWNTAMAAAVEQGITVSEYLRDALRDLAAGEGVEAPVEETATDLDLTGLDETCSECEAHPVIPEPDPAEVEVEDGDETAEADELAVSAPPAAATEDGRVAAIYGTGQLSQSDDPETQAAVTRVRELLTEGGVGVSIRHDMNPDDMPSQETIDQLIAEDRWEELDALLEAVTIRPRHVAIVDTPAFSDARLTLNEDGSVAGPIVFEGLWTGDMRMLPYGSLQWDDNLLPIPIIWDRQDGDHTGTVVGVIDTLERQDGVTSAMRPAPITEEQITAITSAAGVTSGLAARYFAKFTGKAAQALRIGAPDASGLRHIWGHAAPKGVCHRSDMGACFQFPGDVDKEHRGFHTGASIALDDGTSIRVGAVTFGGLHIDTGLARRGVSAHEVNRHREDTNKVLAMVRVWEDQFGLAMSGVVPADVTESDLLRAMACAPSVELWPSGRGRTLVGIHIVPTPAWPVAASAGEVQEMTGTQPIEVEDADELTAEERAAVAQEIGWSGVVESLARVEKALALLVADRLIDSVPVPVPAAPVDESDDE